MTTFADLPIDQVRLHPNNVRRSAVADDELVASIKSVGILEPVVVGPADADGVRNLITGNRRYDGCIKAGKTTIPAVIRDDLATDVQQVEAMLVENLNREGLTAVEEAEGYEQLQLFGMDEKAIAAGTGRSRAIVKARLRLNNLPAKALEQLHTGQATLVDAETLLEFADDHEVQASLEAALGTADFRWRAQAARDAITRAARNEKVVEEFKELGAVESDVVEAKRLTSFWTTELQQADAHTEPECLGYTAYDPTSYQSPVLVCFDPDSHSEQEDATRAEAGAGTSRTPDVDWEARRAEAAKKNAERLAGSKVRVDHITSVLRATLPAKGKHAATLAGATRAFLPVAVASQNLDAVAEADVLNYALGVEISGDWQERLQQRADQAATFATAPDSTLLDGLCGVLASMVDVVLSTEGEDAALADIAWEWLTSTGFVLADADVELRAAVTAADDAEDD